MKYQTYVTPKNLFQSDDLSTEITDQILYLDYKSKQRLSLRGKFC